VIFTDPGSGRTTMPVAATPRPVSKPATRTHGRGPPTGGRARPGASAPDPELEQLDQSSSSRHRSNLLAAAAAKNPQCKHCHRASVLGVSELRSRPTGGRASWEPPRQTPHLASRAARAGEGGSCGDMEIELAQGDKGQKTILPFKFILEINPNLSWPTYFRFQPTT
jgi:hypothetical protein